MPRHIGMTGMGDFEELYRFHVEESGLRQARLWYRRQLTHALAAYLFDTAMWSFCVMNNFLKIILRNMRKYPFYNFLNLAGLSLGMVCFLLVGIYVHHEWSFDRHHSKANRIFRVTKSATSSSGPTRQTAAVPGSLAGALTFDYPEMVEETVQFWHYWGLGFNVQYGDNIFNEVNFTFADSNVFRIFDFDFIRGNPDQALSGPYQSVITEAIAQKYFGSEDPMGKTIRINDGYDLLITGVVKNGPSTSHFNFHFFASFSTLKQMPWRRYLGSGVLISVIPTSSCERESHISDLKRYGRNL